MQKFFKLKIIILIIGYILIGCTENNQSSKANTTKGKHQKIEKKINEVESEKSTDSEVYELPSSPIVNTTNYTGYINDLAINVTLNEHDDLKISGEYQYKKYGKSITLIGERTTKYCDSYNISLSEWVSPTELTGHWAIRTGTELDFSGLWYPIDTHNSNIFIDLIAEENPHYLPPLSALVFNTKTEADSFYAKHHFLNNSSEGKKMLVVRDKEFTNNNQLPNYLQLYTMNYDPGECATNFELEAVGEVIDNQRIKMFADNSKQNINRIVDLKFQTPADNFEAVSANSFHKNKEGEICVSLESDQNLVFLLKDLEAYGYHLEGEAYYLKEQINIGLDPSYKFSEEFPLYLFAKPSIKSEMLNQFVVDTDYYFVIQDIVFSESQYWLKVNVYNDKNTEYYHDIKNTDIIETGWIQMYSKVGESYSKFLSLSYYGNGC